MAKLGTGQALWASEDGHSDDESEGFEAQEPTAPIEKDKAPDGHATDLVSLARSRKQRNPLNAQPSSSASVRSSGAAPPMSNTMTTFADKSKYIKAFMFALGLNNHELEEIFLKEVVPDVRKKLRFTHSGPGSRLRDCILCDTPCNAPDPVYGGVIFIIWAHADSGTIEGWVCYHCNSTLRRRYKGFRLSQLQKHIKDSLVCCESCAICTSRELGGARCQSVLLVSCKYMCVHRCLSCKQDKQSNRDEFDARRHKDMMEFAGKDCDHSRSSTGGDQSVYHELYTNQVMQEQFKLGNDLLWTDEDDFVAFFGAKPDVLKVPYHSQKRPDGQWLKGWRTEEVDFGNCDNLNNRKPRSAIVIDMSFRNEVGVKGHFGTDNDDLENIADNAAALTANRLKLGQGADLSTILKKKDADAKKAEQQEKSEEAYRQSGLGDEKFDPAALDEDRLNPLGAEESGAAPSPSGAKQRPRTEAASCISPPAKKAKAIASVISSSRPSASPSPLPADTLKRKAGSDRGSQPKKKGGKADNILPEVSAEYEETHYLLCVCRWNVLVCVL